MMVNQKPLELEQIEKSGNVSKTKNKKNKEEKNRNISDKLNKAKRA